MRSGFDSTPGASATRVMKLKIPRPGVVEQEGGHAFAGEPNGEVNQDAVGVDRLVGEGRAEDEADLDRLGHLGQVQAAVEVSTLVLEEARDPADRDASVLDRRP